MTRLSSRLILLNAIVSAIVSAGAAQGAELTLRYCLAAQSVPGYMDSEKFTGLAERLALDAGKRVGLKVEFIVAPRARCRIMFTRGEAEVMALAPIQDNLDIAEFPGSGSDAVDPARALVSMNIGIVRRRGDSFSWNGQKFLGKQPNLVGIRRGGLAILDALKPAGVHIDDTATNTALLITKVERERVDVAAGLSADLAAQLQETPQAALELLEPSTPVPVLLYPAVERQFAAKNRTAIEAWWREIGLLRQRPEYQLRPLKIKAP